MGAVRGLHRSAKVQLATSQLEDIPISGAEVLDVYVGRQASCLQTLRQRRALVYSALMTGRPR